MKVEICKSIDIETEVDVTAEDIVNELTSKLADITAAVERRESWRYFVSALSTCLMIFKKVPSEIIDQVPQSTREVFAVHLAEQAYRWTESSAEVKNG